jgi:hypothetical protein
LDIAITSDNQAKMKLRSASGLRASDATVKEKAARLRQAGIILVMDRVSIVENDHTRLFGIADDLIRADGMCDHTIILLSVDGPSRYHSGRFHRGQTSLERQR